MKDYIYKDKTFKLIGLGMEIHGILGRGLREIVYKDALEFEFKNHGIPFEREKNYKVEYKGVSLKHEFYADFVVFNDIILEVKAKEMLIDEDVFQTLNYISICQAPLGLIMNFGPKSLEFKRVINSDWIEKE